MDDGTSDPSAPRPTGDRDQHFLTDERVLDRIVDAAPPGDHALEIGGGAGALTDRLVGRYDDVTVIELEPGLAEHLASAYPDAEVVQGDATEVPLPEYDVCVANLPYSATSPLLFRLLPRREPAVLTMQAEVADRLTAGVGEDDYGRLSVTAGYFAESEVLERVPPSAFEPAPEVTSAVVAATPRPEPPEVGDVELFLDVVRGIFTQRRKTLRNAIRNTTHITGIQRPDEVVAALPDGLPDRRPGRVSPEEFAAITRAVVERRGHG